MKLFNWQVKLGIILIILSAIVYLIHYAIFRDPHHIIIYLIGDIAFVFIEVLMVTLVIHSLLTMRERKERLEKLNMIIGVFFSEIGTRLLVHFSDSDPNINKIKQDLVIDEGWSDDKFKSVCTKLRSYSYTVEIKKIDLKKLYNFLIGKRDFLLRLLENPNLLEHESFTNLLRAIFHLEDELSNRKNLKNLPKSDYKHLSGDITRSYDLLVYEWLDYMHYLKNNYPYLFSLAMRTNPFDEEANPEIL